MKNLRLLLSVAIMALTVALLSSCESSKIAYGNSYYFKQTPKKIEPRQSAAKNETLVASVEKNPAEAVSVSDKMKASLTHLTSLTEDYTKLNATLHSEKQELSRSEKRTIRQEKKEHKKQMRKELKTVIKEYRTVPKVVKEKHAQEAVTGNLRAGIIIGAVGLILLLLGGGSVLSLIGLIMVIVGLVLILIDVI